MRNPCLSICVFLLLANPPNISVSTSDALNLARRTESAVRFVSFRRSLFVCDAQQQTQQKTQRKRPTEETPSKPFSAVFDASVRRARIAHLDGRRVRVADETEEGALDRFVFGVVVLDSSIEFQIPLAAARHVRHLAADVAVLPLCNCKRADRDTEEKKNYNHFFIYKK